MKQTRTLHWPLALGLGALALIRPLVRIVSSQLGIEDPPAVAIGLTVLISAVWVLVVGRSHRATAVPTLLVTGVTYGVLAIAISGVLSPLLDGQLQGPLANPIAIVPMLMVNALWGLAAGAVAHLLQRGRGTQQPTT